MTKNYYLNELKKAIVLEANKGQRPVNPAATPKRDLNVAAPVNPENTAPKTNIEFRRSGQAWDTKLNYLEKAYRQFMRELQQHYTDLRAEQDNILLKVDADGEDHVNGKEKAITNEKTGFIAKVFNLH